MKTKIKAIIFSCLTAASFAVCGIGANASGIDIDENELEITEVSNTGANPNQPEVTLEEQLEKVQNDPELTEEQRQKHIEKIEYLISVRDGTYAEPLALSLNFSGFLDVPFIKQEYENYCGPATTLQTYKYFKRYTVLNQETIAGEFQMVPHGGGCDFEGQILKYLNDNVGTTYHTCWLSASAYDLSATKILVRDSIDNKIPPILWMKVTDYSNIDTSPNELRDKSKWPYYTGGHYLNISGYTSYGMLMEMTDPYLPYSDGYSDTTTGVFRVSSETVYMLGKAIGA